MTALSRRTVLVGGAVVGAALALPAAAHDVWPVTVGGMVDFIDSKYGAVMGPPYGGFTSGVRPDLHYHLYCTLTSGGPKVEGYAFPVNGWWDTEEQAVYAYMMELHKFMVASKRIYERWYPSKFPQLVWREKPVLTSNIEIGYDLGNYGGLVETYRRGGDKVAVYSRVSFAYHKGPYV